MSHDSVDQSVNFSGNTSFQEVLSSAVQNRGRRNIIKGGLGLATLAALPGLAVASKTVAQGLPSSLAFPSVAKSVLDQVTLPPGYSFTVLHAAGDPIDTTVPAYTNAGLEKDDWSHRIGDHHDGMDLYYIDGAGRYSTTATSKAVLCVNHESSADSHFLHPAGQTSNGQSRKKFDQFGFWDLGARPELEVLKEINLHGVSVVELQQTGKGFSYKIDSTLNRRITPETPMRIAGAREHLADIQKMMRTAFDASGATSRGTLNNCGHGMTPWGTYLTCEENWARYFQIAPGANPGDAKHVTSLKRYGVASAPLDPKAPRASSQGWHTVSNSDNRFTRWNLAVLAAEPTGDFRNEAYTFGYNVEIDPLNPGSTSVKRVSMGRFAHEAAVCGIPEAGKPLAFYMGCDSVNEYIYKFVSKELWDPKDVGGGLAAGDKYLNEGALYVARFDADGTGRWLELSFNNPAIANFPSYRFANQADVWVNARLAADAVGATPMDRPEWGAVNHLNGEIYFALTNNNATHRTPAKVNAANPRSYADVDGRKSMGNPNGHIIRFREESGLSTAASFSWDIFLFGAEEDAGSANLSGLTAANDFSSPDGLWFSKATGICWIQTDDGAMTDETNCMMLAAIPGKVGDGAKRTVANKLTIAGAEQTGTQETFIGATLGEGRLKRFLVAPSGSEVTGVAETPDGKTMFVNIQHPGEKTPALGQGDAFKLESSWPGNAGYGKPGRPRSATIVITRDDGGLIGL
jgi:secreted PhoX family phosphatase